MKQIIENFITNWEKLFKKEEKRDKFSQKAREQFLELKEKGLSIPVFTL